MDLAKATGSLKGNYIAIDATDDQVTLIGDQVTPEIIAKFQWPDILTLNAPGATLSGLPTATLLAANVVNLDADNDQVTLAGDKINAGIIYKFTDVADRLTLQASGSMLAALSLGSRMLTLDASDGKITLTSVQFADLVLNGSQVHTSDAITINDLDNDQSLHLNAAGGAGVTVVFNSLINAPESITHFTAATDTLQFSKDAFAALSLTPDNTAIAADEFYSAADVTGTGAEGTADTRFLYNTTDGHLFYDGDGSAAGDAVRLAILTDSPDDLAAADLVMIA